MTDYIDRDKAIDALNKTCDIVCQYSKKQRAVMCGACPLGSAFDVIEELPSAQPELGEWCDTCKEYDQERHCCPRFNRVIKKALEDVDALKTMPSAQSELIQCKDCKYYEIWQLKSDGTDDKRYKPSVCVKGAYAVHHRPDWFCADAERRTDG